MPLFYSFSIHTITVFNPVLPAKSRMHNYSRTHNLNIHHIFKLKIYSNKQQCLVNCKSESWFNTSLTLPPNSKKKQKTKKRKKKKKKKK